MEGEGGEPREGVKEQNTTVGNRGSLLLGTFGDAVERGPIHYD